MSKIRNLPEITTLEDNDLLYAVDESAGTNGGRKIKKSNLKTSVTPTAAETKAAYESNPDTNAFTDADKLKLDTIHNEYVTSVVSGRVVHYTEGQIHYNGVIYHTLAGDILLNSNITNAHIYVDIDGVVKQTGANSPAPNLTFPIAKFSTDLTSVVSLEDHRVFINRNLDAGQAINISSIEPDAVAASGTIGRYADAGHVHAISTDAPSTTHTPTTANTEGVSTSFARADHTHDIASAAPTTNLSPATSNTEGMGSSFARNDHTHAVETGLSGELVSVSAGDSASAGTVDKFARIDHQHPVDTGTPSTQTPDQANAEGSSSNLARADHIHNIPADAPTTPLSPATTNAEGSGSSFARNDHTHSISTGLVGEIVPIQPDDTANAGVVDKFARVDHRHAVSAAAPTTTLSPATTNAEGVGTSFSRNDHTHAIATALVADITTIQPDDAAAAGVANTFARGDHKHAIAAAAPSTQTPDQANAEGISTSFARADHVHNIPADAPTTTLTPVTTNAEGVGSSFARNDHTHAIATGIAGEIGSIQPDDAAAAGTIDKYARIDHKHPIVTDTPVNTGTANAEGNATSFARSNHVHNTIIANSAATATADDTTASLTDVLIVGMTLTPAAGTYLATFSSSVLNSANGASRLFVSLYAAGSQVAHSEREIGISGGANVPVHSNAVIQVNGSQAIEARWRAVAGTNTAHERSLTLIRLGD